MVFKNVKDVPVGPYSHLESTLINKTGEWRNMRPVLDRSKCIRCYICWKFCPDVAIKILPDGNIEHDYEFCKGCGICANECPKKAITMVREE
ncbi:MAG: 4Fe-4S binding protein [Thermoplasmata archaeon]